jgi:hypothetical protein
MTFLSCKCVKGGLKGNPSNPWARFSSTLRVLIEIEGAQSKFSISSIGGVHIGVRALLVIYLIWFGFIAHLSQWGGGGIFLLVRIYLPSQSPEEGGESAP